MEVTKHFLARVVGLIVLPLLLYVTIFAVHVIVLNKRWVQWSFLKSHQITWNDKSWRIFSHQWTRWWFLQFSLSVTPNWEQPTQRIHAWVWVPNMMMQLPLLKFVHLWYFYLMWFFPSLILTSVLLYWCSPSIRLHHYSKEPPYSWWIFTLSLAPLPRGGRGKAAAGQIPTTNHRLFNLLYLNSFCHFRWRPTITRTITTCGLFRGKTIMNVNTLFKFVKMTQ